MYKKLRSEIAGGDAAFLRDIASHVQAEAEAGRLECVPLLQEGIGLQTESLECHPFPELFVQIRGINRFTFPSQTLDLAPGQVTVVPPWLPHGEETIRREGDFLMLVVTSYVEGCSTHFSIAPDHPSGQRLGHREYFYSSHGLHMMNLCREFFAAASLPSPAGTRVCRGVVQAIMAYIDYLLAHGVQQEESHLVVKAKHHLGRHIAQPSLNVKTMARDLKCNPDYLSNLFHTITGERLTEYIRRLRLAQSRDLLLNTTLTVAEIARVCGFHTPNYFSRVFREAHNASPGNYRKYRTQRHA